VLAEELGIDPSPELQRLHQAILVQDPALELAGPARQPPRHNLPEPLTSLIGREEELAEVAKLVELHRLVTVTGPGGAGKTTVATELARRRVDAYPDGVWLVELAGLADPALLAEVVIAALGLAEDGGPPDAAPPAPADRLARFVADKVLLVVLDNCEHLVGACAGLVQRLLEAGPAVRVLATSRELLGVPGEAVWPVPPLAVGPDPAAGQEAGVEVLARYDAVRLFAERAAAADPGFALAAANAAVVAELCRRLDGLPLAIELAAARVRALPPAEILARLDDRFRLLAGGRRTVDARQQTLRATVDWSWGLLEEGDRRLLRRLSVFSGGWTVAAAEAVCGGDGLAPAEVLEGLFGLVDRSLVVAVGGDPARFRLLETLRAYGAERLAEAGEAGAVAARHTGWFLELAEQAAVHRTARRWLRRLDADYDNLRAVLDRATAAPDPETALRLAGALGWYWVIARSDEGRQRLAGALAMADGRPPTPAVARALQAMALTEVQRTPTAATVDAATRSLELFERFGDEQGAAFTKVVLASAELQRRGPSADAVRLTEEAEAAFAAAGDRWGETFAEFFGANIEAHLTGAQDRTEEVGRRALERFRALDDQWGAAVALVNLAMTARARGDLEAAAARFEAALAAARDGGPLWVELASLVSLAAVVATRGEDARAAALHAEAAVLARRAGEPRATAHAYNELGAIARARGDLERARQLHREALVLVRRLVGWSVPYTLAQLACAEARLGDLDAAEAHLAEAAGLVLATPQPATAALALVGGSLVAAGHDRPQQAARLLAAAEATRERTGVAAVGAEAVEAELAGRAARAGLGPDAFAAATAGGHALATDDALRELVVSA
jgi:predicted ATPase